MAQFNNKTSSGSSPAASDVSYDNTASGLTSDNVQGAIDENKSMITANTEAIANLGTAQGVFGDFTNPTLTLTTTEQDLPFTVITASTDTDIFEFDDTNNTVNLKQLTSYDFRTDMTFSYNTPQERTITVRGRDKSDDTLIYERTVVLENTVGVKETITTNKLVTIDAVPKEMYFTVQASGTGIELYDYTSTLFSTGGASTGGGVTSWVYANGTNTQAVTNTNVKLKFGTEQWDLNDEFDNSTYIFTAKANKKYQINMVATYAAKLDDMLTYLRVYKNGTLFFDTFKKTGDTTSSNTKQETIQLTTFVDMLVDDYLEFYVYSDATSSQPLMEITSARGYLSVMEIPTS